MSKCQIQPKGSFSSPVSGQVDHESTRHKQRHKKADKTTSTTSARLFRGCGVDMHKETLKLGQGPFMDPLEVPGPSMCCGRHCSGLHRLDRVSSSSASRCRYALWRNWRRDGAWPGNLLFASHSSYADRHTTWRTRIVGRRARIQRINRGI